MKTIYTAVSFEKTPLLEIGPKANEILQLGWVYYERVPHRWCAKFHKDFPEGTPAAQAENEVAEIMGDYYVTAEELSPD